MPIHASPTAFFVYRWVNPETNSDYPFLAVAEDKSLLLSLGNYGLTIDWGIPDEAAAWLARDFEANGESLLCDLSTVELLLKRMFAGGAEFLSITFTPELVPSGMRLALACQQSAEHGPEYLIHKLHDYQRVYREPDRISTVSDPEVALLDVTVATFSELAQQYTDKMREPPPPRYRAESSLEPKRSH